MIKKSLTSSWCIVLQQWHKPGQVSASSVRSPSQKHIWYQGVLMGHSEQPRAFPQWETVSPNHGVTAVLLADDGKLSQGEEKMQLGTF